jgi:hypothetical protein
MPGTKEIRFTNFLPKKHSEVIDSWLLHFQKNGIPCWIIEKEKKEPKGKLQVYRAVWIEIQKK